MASSPTHRSASSAASIRRCRSARSSGRRSCCSTVRAACPGRSRSRNCAMSCRALPRCDSAPSGRVASSARPVTDDEMATILQRLGMDVRRDGDALGGDCSAVALRHRDRGGPDRGGRARLRLRPDPGDGCRRARVHAGADRDAGGAGDRGGPAGAARLLRGDHLQLRRSRAAGAVLPGRDRARAQRTRSQPTSRPCVVSLWPGLAKALVENQRRQQSRVRLFEIGRRFNAGEWQRWSRCRSSQDSRRARRLPEQWGARAEAVEFFDVKADVEALLRATGASGEFRFVAAQHPALASGPDRPYPA